MTAYTPNHTAGEVSGIVIDFLVEYGVALLSFVTLIALVLLWTWFKGNLK